MLALSSAGTTIQSFLRRRWQDVLAVGLLALSGYVYFYQPGRVQEVGTAAPALTATTLEGKAFDASGLKGRVVLVNFWATWCGYCRKEMPDLEALHQKYEAKGLTILALSVDDSSAKVQDFWAKNPYQFPVAMASGALQAQFGGVEVLPTFYLIDSEGIIRHQIKGSIRAATLETLVKKYL